jgi:hypothetical protein
MQASIIVPAHQPEPVDSAMSCAVAADAVRSIATFKSDNVLLQKAWGIMPRRGKTPRSMNGLSSRHLPSAFA